MRIAHVLQLATSTSIVALERDGALYDIAELDRCFGARLPDVAGVSDFHTRVIALGCAGLGAHDERLRSGDRPSAARLFPGAFLWLPPCAADRTTYVQLRTCQGESDLDPPTYRIGNARGMLGHEASVPFPSSEEEPDFELSLGVVLGEDLSRATPEEVERAVLGFTVLNDWVARGVEGRARARGLPDSAARDFATQLGPVLVTADEIGPVESLRTQVRVGGVARACAPLGGSRFSLAESVAFLSGHIDLRAGDVIGTGCVGGGSAASVGEVLRFGSAVELVIERIGRLMGRPVRGPEPVAWRRRA